MEILQLIPLAGPLQDDAEYITVYALYVHNSLKDAKMTFDLGN